jgi:hypothetical protein
MECTKAPRAPKPHKTDANAAQPVDTLPKPTDLEPSRTFKNPCRTVARQIVAYTLKGKCNRAMLK